MKATARRLVVAASGFAMLGMALAGCGGGVNAESTPEAAATGAATAAAAPADCGSWTIAMHNWVGYTASAQVLTNVAQDALGCTITQTKLDSAGVSYDAMEAGSVDVIVEDWGGGRWSDWVGRGAIQEVGWQGNIGLTGMFVPAWMAEEYPDITDGTKLNDYWELFQTPESGDKGAWYEGPPGYTTIGQKLIDANKLNFKAINVGSEQALIDLLEKGQADKKAALVYFWEPNWVLAKVPSARVNFPEADWTDPAEASGLTDYPALELMKLGSTTLMESGSPFATLFANFTWTNDDQNAVALDIQDGMTPEEAAQKWIDAHSDQVKAWLQGTGAE